MFNNHMSYFELSFALHSVRESSGRITASEWRCLDSSLKDPFLKEQFKLYPLSSRLMKFISDETARYRAEARRAGRQEIDLNVHSTLYGGSRAATAHYLRSTFPVRQGFDVMASLTRFIESSLEDRESCEQLAIAEKSRYEERQRAGLTQPLHSAQEIAQDFRDYIQYLSRQKANGSTYAWEALGALLHRFESLTGSVEAIEEARLTLLRSLDDARTAYHAKTTRYVEGKDYTCQKGLEERLLDHHNYLSPQVVAPEGYAGQAVQALCEAFVTQTEHEGLRLRTFSAALYDLYLQAAGYTTVTETDTVLKLKEDRDESELVREYIGSPSLSEVQQKHLQSRLLSCLATARNNSLEVGGQNFAAERAFLEERGALVAHTVTRESLQAPLEPRSEEDIRRALLESGHFVGEAHLEMVLALHDAEGSLKTLEGAAQAGTLLNQVRGYLPEQEEMSQANSDYLHANLLYQFSHVMHNNLNMGVRARVNLYRIECTQSVLCQYLRNDPPSLGQLRYTIGYSLDRECYNRLAVLCAKAGYAQALSLLIEKYNVNPNYMEPYEGQNLIHLGVECSHPHILEALMNAGANFEAKNRHGDTPLIMAAVSGDIQSAQALINAGANIDAVSGDIQTAHALINPWENIDAVSGDIQTAHALINPWENIDALDEYGTTALIRAAGYGNAEMIQALLNAGANINETHQGKNALYFAVVHNHTQATLALLNAGASLSFQHFYLAAMYTELNRDIFVSVLGTILELKFSKDNRNRDPSHILLKSVSEGDIQSVRRLLADGVNVNSCSQAGLTALDIAAQDGNIEILTVLLTVPNITPCRLVNAIRIAVMTGNEMTAALLLEKQDIARLIVRHNLISSPLSWAVQYRSPAAVEAFIKAGANPQTLSSTEKDEMTSLLKSVENKVYDPAPLAKSLLLRTSPQETRATHHVKPKRL